MSTITSTAALDDLAHFLAAERVVAALDEAERSGSIPEELYAELATRRLFAMAIAPEHGGLGVSVQERLPIHGRVAQISASLHSVLIVHEMVALALQRFAQPAAKEGWLRRLASGESLGAFALTEPAGGSDFAQIQLSAVPHVSGFVLNGAKSWSSSAMRAGVFLVFAKLEGAMVAFIVERANPGLAITPTPPLVAFGATAMGSLRFEDCAVDESAAVGPLGFPVPRVAMACLTLGRVLVAAGALAVGSRSLDLLIDCARTRIVGDAPLAASPLLQKSVAEAYVALRAGRALTVSAAGAIDDGAPSATRDAIVAKLAAAEGGAKATRVSMRVHGASGLRVGSPLWRYQAESMAYSLIEGGEEALSCALASDVLRAGNDLSPPPPRRSEPC